MSDNTDAMNATAPLPEIAVGAAPPEVAAIYREISHFSGVPLPAPCHQLLFFMMCVLNFESAKPPTKENVLVTPTFRQGRAFSGAFSIFLRGP